MKPFEPAPHIICADGFRISIQAHSDLYCSYADDQCTQLTEVEIACKASGVGEETKALESGCSRFFGGGFPDSSELRGWEVFGYSPLAAVKRILRNHGGVVENFEHLPKELQDPALDSNKAVADQWASCLGFTI